MKIPCSKSCAKKDLIIQEKNLPKLFQRFQKINMKKSIRHRIRKNPAARDEPAEAEEEAALPAAAWRAQFMKPKKM